MEEQKTLFTFLDDSELIIYVEWFYFDREARKKVKRLQEEIFDRNVGAVKKLVDFIEAENHPHNTSGSNSQENQQLETRNQKKMQ
jgi:hypothetical protein